MSVDGKTMPYLGFITPKRDRDSIKISLSTPPTATRLLSTNDSVAVLSSTPESIMAPFYQDFSAPSSSSNGPEEDDWRLGGHNTTPLRKSLVGRTFLEERINSSPAEDIYSPSSGGGGGHHDLASSSPDRGQDSGKRGRPRADLITSLIMEGSQSGSTIKCHICSRVFPREKSLQAHLRTHTGERPYTCDYPGCTRAFTQSGQLKTHQRLHAGEKPFVCSAEGCENRYTHANRQCPDHPFAKPQRTTEIILQPNISASEDQEKVLFWLKKYKKEREEKTPGKPLVEGGSGPEEESVSPSKKLKSKRGLMREMNQTVNQENQPYEFSPEPPAIKLEGMRTNTLAAHHTFNQALMRAGERMELNHLLNSSPRTELDSRRFSLDRNHVAESSSSSPLKRSPEMSSPLKSVRRTLGDITPTKNCRSDRDGDLDLPFNFGILTSPPAVSSMPQTPISSEKSGLFSGVHGSPAIKLKKRFQERFQEEKLNEKEVLANPITWSEDILLSGSRGGGGGGAVASSTSRVDAYDLSSSPTRREETCSPTLLVAAALVELHNSPTRVGQEIPLNLTKKSLT